MPENIGSATYELGADRTQLKQDLDAAKQDVQQAGQETEQQAKQSLGKLSTLSGPARAAIVGVGAAMGAVSGMALKMGQDYAGATNTLIRETGASGQALKDLQTSMGNVARQVPEDMNTVALAVANVSKKFQLQGPDLDAATKKLLDYARVNKIDVTEAINGIDDVMDRLKLPATELPGLLDKLTVAEQTTGIKAGDLATSLSAIGPTLQSMGYSLDGSIALIAQWQSIGGSTEELTKGMNKAFLAFAKEGATDAQSAMQMLVDKIKNAPTDMEATQIAADIFGQKIGVTMAQNIRNGGFDVEAFTQKIQDSGGQLDATTERTKTWSDRFHEFFNSIATQVGPITGQLGELGMGFSGLTKILTPLGTAMGGLAGLFISGFKGLAAKVLPTAVAAGTTIGAATGEAEAVAQAEAATGTSAVAKLGARITAMGAMLAPAGTAAGTVVGAAMGAAMVVGIAYAAEEASKNTDLRNAAAAPGRAFFGAFGDESKGLLHGTVVDSLTDGFHDLWHTLSEISIPLGDDAGSATGTAYADGVATTIGTTTAGKIAAEIARLMELYKKYGIGMGTAVVDGVSGTTAKGWDGIAQQWIARGAAAAYAAGAAITHQLALGIDSNQSSVRDEWKQYVDDLKHPFDAMKEIAFLNGKLSGQKLADGLNSSDPITRARAEEMRDHITAQLNDLKALGYDIGDGTGNRLADGIDDSTPAAVTQAEQLKNKVNAQLAAIQNRINIRVTRSNSVGGASDTGGVDTRAVGGPVKKGVPYKVGEKGEELFVPDEDGTIVPHPAWASLKTNLLGALGAMRVQRFDMDALAGLRGSSEPSQVTQVHNHFHIGTLIADEAGLAELGRRIEYAGGFEERTRMPLGGAY